MYFPLCAGYANTLLKMQGATLEHLTIWLDKANVEAAGYVAEGLRRRPDGLQTCIALTDLMDDTGQLRE